MSTHSAVVDWQRGDQVFSDGRYSRGFLYEFDGGVTLPGSASPGAVPPPRGRIDAADPEEMLIAALSSCHMLYFLDFARRDGFVVDRYRDDAVGTLGKDADGRWAITRIALRPAIAFVGDGPDAAALASLHARAHGACIIAHTVRAEVVVEAAVG